MKLLPPAILMLFMLGVGLAQAPAAPSPAPDIVVIENGWRRVVSNPALDDDPLRAGRETIEFEQAKQETARVNKVLREMGRDPLPPPTKNSSGLRMGNRSVMYVYDVKIKNTGTKSLRAVVWHYAFFDADKQIEVGRTSCTSKVNLRPGKTANLVGTSRQPPVGVIDVSKSGKALRGIYAERVEITRLEYTDGSFWQRPAL